MFTGLVQGLGQIVAWERSQDGVRLSVSSVLAGELAPGDSIAVNGVCLTASDTEGDVFVAEVMNETLLRSSLRDADGDGDGEVNLELPLRASDRLGGHIVQGHVDGVGTVVAISDDGFSRRISVDVPEGLSRYIVEKGSIAVDGVSLTVAGCDSETFTVSLIPETLQRTNLGKAQVGTRTNLEVDVLAKYVERLMSSAL
jgi:riboflavin synthase